MQKTHYFSTALIAVAILSGCTTPKNSSLANAHSIYDNARSNPQVTELAALELKEAGDSLSKADTALSKGESDDKINQLAYITTQQVRIAQETANRKAAELAVANAGAKRDQVRLEARTVEADAAKQQVATMQATARLQTAAMEGMQETADQQAAALAAANANAKSDQSLIAQQEMLLKELNAKKTERGMVITLGDVLFSTNKAQLKSGGMRNIQKLADFLKQYPQYKVLVEGYTDSTGSNTLNQKLSERRANAVQTALVGMGISNDRVITRGYGAAFPAASNDTSSGRQLNRRVEIIVSDNNGNISQR